MYEFVHDPRLGILIPQFEVDWDDLSRQDQEFIVEKWEHLREAIPDRIKELEAQLNHKYAQLNKEDDFMRSCQLNSEISEIASIINDLHLWYRIDQNVSAGKPHS